SVGSLLITDPSDDILGIVTDKDLRKCLAVGMDYTAPIEVIMSSPVVTVDSNDICFDALLKMMSRKIHHLAVTTDDQIAGVVTSHDVMVLQGKSPLALFREILSQRSIKGLYPLGKAVPSVIRTLVEEGAKAGNIARMITVINDLILDRLLTLLVQELGRPPVPFSWILMGSEGRKEQTFYTDQDNALVYKDVQDEILQRAISIYFEAFADKAIDHLIKCGFPPCPGKIMASNPRWRQPYSVWRDYFERWITVPEPEQVMNAAIFFDFRTGFGDSSFSDELRDHLALHCQRQELFLRYLAVNCLETKPPLSFFRNFIVEKDGAHKNTLDIKKRGLAPIVDFARVMALKTGIRETNTMGRLEKLKDRDAIPEDLGVDALEAYEFLMHLRLVHQLDMVEMGEEPNNFIDPKKLSDLEKKTLKEAFGVLGRIQTHLKEMFRLNIA
ncbi:MAG: CBS domain-containing protein, partial [Desulfovibrio sp.]